MLTEVHIEAAEDNETVLVQFHGDGESDGRSFWLPSLVLLEHVARDCLGALLDQIKKDNQVKETPAKNSKKTT
jgi:hypothetical protein